ncbi:MAG: efflux RND transporter permease subunit, partial [Lysobacter sp.]|nr:efflux RND transporter permease subunit [Lysobacter sp.]
MSIAELSIRRPITTVMFFVTLVVVGLIAAIRLPLEAFPSVSFPVIFMQMPYQGSTPEEVERTLVRPSEEALATLPGIRNIQSTATANGANIMVLFSDWERDVKIAASEARERIDAIRNDLPDELTRIFVGNASTDDEPVLAIRLASQTLDLSKSYDLIDRELKRRIERVPGVAQVRVSGATANEVEVAIDPQRLTAHGLSLDDLNRRLRDLNFSVSAGQVTDGGQRLRVQPVGELESLEQLRELVLSGNVRLGDVAEVHLKPARNDMGRRLDGRPAVGLDVFKERSANLVEVSRQVLAEVERIQSEPSMRGIQVKIINDQGAVVTDSLLELAEAGAIGLVLSVIVLYFFLRHWPSTLMVSLAIPICFIMTLGFMYFAGVTLNILSMMGLLLAVGMLVDNAVVVVESIYQEREKNPGNPRLASILGTRHVAIALSAGTLCHCIVFVPNLFGERNVLAIYLSQIAITISVSLLASWLVAVSLIPMLSARLKTPPALTSRTGVIHRFQERYAKLLHWSLAHRGKSLLGVFLMVAISVAPVMFTKYNMFGGDEEAETEIGYQWNGSYTVEQMSSEVARVEDFLDARRKDYHITQIYSWFSEQGWGGTRVTFDEGYKGELKPLVDRISKELPKSARARLIVGRQGDGGGGPPKSVQFRLVGDSTQVLNDIARDILPVLERRPELRDVRVDTGDRNQEVQVRIDRERAASFGFTTEQVGTFVGMALRGARLRDFRRDDTEVP